MTFRLKHTEPTEAQVLSAVLAYLRRHPKVVWAERMNAAQGMLVRGKGTKQVSQWMKFGFKGSPDIHGLLDGGIALYIECKRPSTRRDLSPEQANFLDKARSAGAKAFVACSVDDCIREIG